MKGLLCFASVCMIALAASGSAQESKKQPAKGEITKAVFFVPNQHWPACATALEGSMKQVEGIRSATVNFPNKIATVEFDESEISAQEVSRAAFQAPHMMGKDMKYGAFLMLSVPDAKNKAAGAKATAVLEKVKGVEKAVFFPQTKSVAVQFASKGKVTSGELIQALEDTGLKADQYGAKIKK